MGLFDTEGKKRARELEKQAERNRRLQEVDRAFAGGGWWTCLRCGTTNPKNSSVCKECRNRRPF